MTDTDKSAATAREIGDMSGGIRSKLTQLVKVPGLERPVPAWAALIPYDPDSDAIAERIALRAFEAESLEEMLEESPTVPIESLVGGHIRIEAVTLLKSGIEEDNKVGVYCAMEYVNLRDGTRAVTTTSAKGVMMQLANAVLRGWLPFECTVAEVETGKNGRNNPLHLARVVDF